jgi:hypothetical protein
MESLETFFLSIIIALFIFIILTLPHISLMLFDIGIEYSKTVIIIIAIISGLITNLLVIPYLKNKNKL